MDNKKYDEVYDIVVNMARTKMLMNAHKGNIEEISPDALCQKGIEEFEELYEALIAEDKNYTHIIEEAADVLNFAVAAVYEAVTEYRERKPFIHPPMTATEMLERNNIRGKEIKDEIWGKDKK